MNNNLCSHSELKTKHKNGLNFSNVMSAYFPLKKTIMESETEAFPVLTLHSNASLIYPQRSSLETDFTTATFFLHNISYNRQTPHQWLVQGNKDELDKEENQNQHRTWRICSVFSMNNIILLFYYIYFISFICWNPS